MKAIILLLLSLSALNTDKKSISFKTTSGSTVTIIKDIIYFNKKPISRPIVGINYSGKYNKLIEEDSTVLLFVECLGSPNYNYLTAFKITDKKAIKLVDCVYNDKTQGIGPAPFTDMDKDGYVEFGGFDLTEVYNSKDSVYYNPSQYYEINKGVIRFDSALTKKMDIKINGIYLRKPLDKQGNCCKVIKKLKNH